MENIQITIKQISTGKEVVIEEPAEFYEDYVPPPVVIPDISDIKDTNSLSDVLRVIEHHELVGPTKIIIPEETWKIIEKVQKEFDPSTIKTFDGKTLRIFKWQEGNDSCDCNRSLHFRRINGESPDLSPPTRGGASSRQDCEEVYSEL